MTRDYKEEIANGEDNEIDSLLTNNYIAAKSWIVLFLQHQYTIQKNIHQKIEKLNVINMSYNYILNSLKKKTTKKLLTEGKKDCLKRLVFEMVEVRGRLR